MCLLFFILKHNWLGINLLLSFCILNLRLVNNNRFCNNLLGLLWFATENPAEERLFNNRSFGNRDKRLWLFVEWFDILSSALKDCANLLGWLGIFIISVITCMHILKLLEFLLSIATEFFPFLSQLSNFFGKFINFFCLLFRNFNQLSI